MRVSSKARRRVVCATLLTVAFCMASSYRLWAWQVAPVPLMSLATLVPFADAAHQVTAAPCTSGDAARPTTILSAAVRAAMSVVMPRDAAPPASATHVQDGDVNRVYPGDGTPLIIAARAGDVNLVRSLLDRGADPNLASPGDGNPLIMAAAFGRTPVVALLVERGADVNAFVDGDETPLINAASRGALDVVQYLVAHGADINLAFNVEGRDGAERRSPLGQARRHGHTAVAQYLQSLGARP